ncbi:Bug family tripartite tricarboxylate transporter substrate binding protein [Chelativorans oligotrophicus]|uniref:Bug family tripartite tricarboxylate transporter substrate binding protein n=1 Tax=Chelativorans oligotrophicus TaxID=449974 RepID=UPI00140A3CF3|nr:tripartite tricarboxylate transporter substrate binding protein [Chelativorans oligotrophicus]
MRLSLKFIAGAVMAACLGLAPASAQDYPTRSITIVAPFAAGGSVDVAARIFAEAMSRSLGQPIQIENVGGAGSILGAQRVATAAPDGYTILYNSSNLVLNLSLYAKLDYDLFKDFDPIALTATGPQVLGVTKSLPVENFTDFVEYARAHPGEMSFPSSGPGNITHIRCEMLMSEIGSSAAHIPYQGGASQYPDLISGRTHFAMASASSMIPFHQNGELRILAVTSEQPIPQLPGVPTFAELGYPNMTVGAWQGLLAPAGTPPEIIAKLEKAANDAAADPKVIEALGRHGLIPFPSTAEKYGEFLASEAKRWGPIMTSMGIQPQ